MNRSTVGSARSAEKLLGALPEISEISNTELREKVTQVWLDLWVESSWDDIEACPKNPANDRGIRLVAHTRSVVHSCVAMADGIQKFHGIETDRDLLLAGALLHDADKIIMWGGEEKSTLSKMVVHPTYAAHKMLAADFPLELVNLVLCHSGPEEPLTTEGFIVRMCDRAETQVTRSKSQR